MRRRIRVLTDEEQSEQSKRAAEIWSTPRPAPPIDAPPRPQISRMFMGFDDWISLLEDIRGYRFKDSELLDEVNKARKQWGFGPITELLGYYEEG